MNADDFKNSPSGRLVPTIHGRMAFVPHPLPPPHIDLARLAAPLANAALALGELSGIGRTLPNPNLLIRPFSRVEAVASSKIEGTVTSAPELLMLELSPSTQHVSADTREVHNYILALQRGLNLVPSLPLSKRLFRELHEVLLDGVSADRGARFAPGQFKTDQNWIGSRTIENARFVPPPPDDSMTALDELEKFIHRKNEDLPLLVKLALIHYQFETIHPFPDGNGRVGRLIVPLMLCEQKALSQPLLYLSAYLEKHYDTYIDLMYDVSRSGSWDNWIAFFLTGVETAARNAITKSHALQDSHRDFMGRIRTARTSALLAMTIDSLFEIPATTVPHVSRELKISYNAAKNNLKRLLDLGIIGEGDKDRRPLWFYAREIMRITNAPDS
ncbi:cell filamentation protein Fic [Hypericibacter terrae]|uniref:Cell filamentation protein Fic n=1 Tax=Hypericibacter terrae TaxID=2602015 RepID=A0A5J6MNC5_9PROT|nr:Fic family protein [Hypericibacter terrae]QEX19182.1 cell filamentation protein Fic [Hypericibacter terrae]